MDWREEKSPLYVEDWYPLLFQDREPTTVEWTNTAGFLIAMFPETFSRLRFTDERNISVVDWFAGRALGCEDSFARDQIFRVLLRRDDISEDVLMECLEFLLPTDETDEETQTKGFNYYCWAEGLSNPRCPQDYLTSTWKRGKLRFQFPILANPACPEEVIIDACMIPHDTLRTTAVNHPNCPDEGHVAFELYQRGRRR